MKMYQLTSRLNKKSNLKYGFDDEIGNVLIRNVLRTIPFQVNSLTVILTFANIFPLVSL